MGEQLDGCEQGRAPNLKGCWGARPSEGPYNLNHVRIETRKGFGRRSRPAFIAPYTESLVESGEEEEGWERAGHQHRQGWPPSRGTEAPPFESSWLAQS